MDVNGDGSPAGLDSYLSVGLTAGDHILAIGGDVTVQEVTEAALLGLAGLGFARRRT